MWFTEFGHICDKTNNQLEHVFIFSAVTFPTSYQRVTVHVGPIVHWYDMLTNIIIRYDSLVGYFSTFISMMLRSTIEDSMNYPLRISPKWHRSKIKTPVSSETTLLTPWLTSFSVHSKCLIAIFWFSVQSAYIWSKYYIIMATFCWHIITTRDYKLMCRCVQVMEHCILFNVGPLFDDSSD